MHCLRCSSNTYFSIKNIASDMYLGCCDLVNVLSSRETVWETDWFPPWTQSQGAWSSRLQWSLAHWVLVTFSPLSDALFQKKDRKKCTPSTVWLNFRIQNNSCGFCMGTVPNFPWQFFFTPSCLGVWFFLFSLGHRCFLENVLSRNWTQHSSCTLFIPIFKRKY